MNAGNGEEKSILLVLSKACEKHRQHCHCRQSATEEQEEEEEEEGEDTDRQCQQILTKLREVILPQVEKKYSPEMRPSPSDVGNLCDFYCAALDCSFCPLASTIFQPNQTDPANGVLPRLEVLFRQLTSRRIIQASLRGNSLPEQKLCAAVARFLVASKADAKDIIDLSIDLSVILEARLLEQNETVSLSLFASVADQKSSRCTLELNSQDELFFCQSATFKIMLQYVTMVREDIIHQPKGEQGFVEKSDMLFDFLTPSASGALFASIRQTLLKTDEFYDFKSSALVLRSKQAALQILEAVLGDWHGTSSTAHSVTITEVALIVSKSILVFASGAGSSAVHRSVAVLRGELSGKLANLIWNFVIHPPTLNTDIQTRLRSVVMPDLLRCLQHFGALVEHPSLIGVLLQCVSVCLYRGSKDASEVSNFCSSNGLFGSVVTLLGTPTMRNIAIDIVNFFLSHSPKDFEAACLLALVSAEAASKESAEVAKPTKVSKTPAARKNAKRKLRPLSLKAPLQIESSPKRSRRTTGAAAFSDVRSTLGCSTNGTPPENNPTSFLQVLSSFLCQALRLIRFCGSDFEEGPFSVEQNISAVCGVTALVMQNQSHHDTQPANSAIVKVSDVLVGGVVAVCSALSATMKHRDTTKRPIPPAAVSAVDQLVDMALNVYFIHSNGSLRIGSAVAGLCWELIGFRSRGSSVKLAAGEPTPLSSFLCPRCLSILNTFQSTPQRNFWAHYHRCSCQIGAKSKVSERSLPSNLGFDSISVLPPISKLALLSCLRPVALLDPSGEILADDQLGDALQKCYGALEERTGVHANGGRDNPIDPLIAMFFTVSPLVALTVGAELIQGQVIRYLPPEPTNRETLVAALCEFPFQLLANLASSRFVCQRRQAFSALTLSVSVASKVEDGDIECGRISNHATLLSLFELPCRVETESIPSGLYTAVLSLPTHFINTNEPVEIFQAWKCFVCVLGVASKDRTHRILRNTSKDNNLLNWMLKAPFIETSFSSRLLMARDFGSMVMGKEAAFQVHQFAKPGDPSDMTVRAMFVEIDKLLYAHSSIRESQLPSSMILSGAPAPPGEQSSSSARHVHFTAVCVLASLCHHAEVDTALGLWTFGQSLCRLIRIWSTVEDLSGAEVEDSHFFFSAMAFSEMRRLDLSKKIGRIFQLRKVRRLFLGDVFKETLCHGENFLEVNQPLAMDSVDQQYKELAAFVQSFQLSGPRERKLSPLIVPGSNRELLEFASSVMQWVFPSMVVDMDYEALLMATGFKVFVMRKNADRKHQTDRGDSRALDDVGMTIKAELKSRPLIKSKLTLAEHTQTLCLTPAVLDQTLARLLVRSRDRHNTSSRLKFLIETVLHGKRSLNNIWGKNDKLVLKWMLMELEDNSEYTESASKAVLTDAATFRFGMCTQQEDVPCRWISSWFMYCLVNVVQKGWREKSLDEKVAAMRSLKLLLAFLIPDEAPPFLPQVFATIGMATSHDLARVQDIRQRTRVLELFLLSAECLSVYIKSLVSGHLQVIGEYLSMVVVSLLPMLSGDVLPTTESNEEKSLLAKAQEIAVDLLETLTAGDVGRELSAYLKDVPFVPNSPSLEPVHKNLRAVGINFDDVLTTSQTTQSGRLTDRDSITSDGAAEDESGGIREFPPNSITAMQTRLTVLQPLILHENVSVRIAVLQHLLDLLSVNRALFYRIVETEEQMSLVNFVTVRTFCSSEESKNEQIWYGTATKLLQTLLSQSTAETDPRLRSLIASCLGEVGAIDPHRLGPITTWSEQRWDSLGKESDRVWQLNQPPWQSTPERYQLQLLTKHLVLALRTASSSMDQHKIAFTIQQLLVNLDRSTTGAEPFEGHESLLSSKESASSKRKPMNPWLCNKLKESNLFDIFEPYWHSTFREVDVNTKHFRKPPHFKRSKNYSDWISHWCRFLIASTREDETHNKWRDVFYSCRTAVRSPDGQNVAEFILPLLVLDRLCCPGKDGAAVVIEELKDVLNTSAYSEMSTSEKNKAINTVFVVLDTLEGWSSHEMEERSKRFRARSSRSRYSATSRSDGNGICSPDQSLEAIRSLEAAIPIVSRANAAAVAGMHPRSLRYLEMLARSSVVDTIFDSSRPKANEHDPGVSAPSRRSPAAGSLVTSTTKLLASIFGNLRDFPSLKATQESAPSSQWDQESVAEKEARGDWSGALNEYERSLQTPHLCCGVGRSVLEKGVLRCLLKLGQYESILNQVGGIRSRVAHNTCSSVSLHVIPFAVEAAWRLGRWSELESLVRETNDSIDEVDLDARYQLSVGKAMLALESRSSADVTRALESGRVAVLSKLSGLARESYSRSYQCLVNLQCLKEIEDAWSLWQETVNPEDEEKARHSEAFARAASSKTNGGWAWEARLKAMEKDEISDVLDTRLALSRIFGAHSTEARLYSLKGTDALRKNLGEVASHCFGLSQATLMKLEPDTAPDEESSALACSIRMELSRLMHMHGDSAAAFRLLDIDDTKGWGKFETEKLRTFATDDQKRFMRRLNVMDPEQCTKLTEGFTERLLQTTKWMVDGRLKSFSETLERFQIVNQLAPNWEEGHFEFARFADAMLEARLNVLSPHLSNATQAAQETHARQLLLSEDIPCQDYLVLAIQQYISAIRLDPRHLYQALPRLLALWFEFTALDGSLIRRGKKRAGPVQVSSDPLAFLHGKQDELNELFRQCVRSVAAQSFYTAIPQLISRVSHRSEKTRHVVHSILLRILTKFPGQAMWAMAWLRNSVNSQREAIGNLIFDGAIDSLKKRKDKRGEALLVASKSFVEYFIGIAKFVPREKDTREFDVKVWTGEVEIGDFVPPVQAALSSPQDSRSTDLLPRMRTLHKRIQVMHSKAKPKRVKFFVIAGNRFRHLKRKGDLSGEQYDVGELHFLAKQEAKGDLRKDARVQNLNVVINRLLASAATNARDHRLHLTTFAVTCLSEDCGILEWVPNTDSMRNSLSKAYNPLASPFSPRRRGKRSADFADPNLRQSFEKSQNIFFKNGDLTKATQSFDKTCISCYPPVFYWWFVQHFLDPYLWYEARTRYTLSVAAWSAVGHVIGLGDRHSENLLLDTVTGACVHVDFDCIFDKGLSLPRPEVVPFRLTPNMLDAMGPVGADGMFASSLKSAMSVLRQNKDVLLSVLEPFLNDPIIDWRRIKSSQRGSSKECSDAKRSIKVIEERLLGVYNLRNPNYKKYQRTDKIEDDGEDMTHMLPLSVEGQVQKMITEAASHENLVQLYVGWMPWI